MALGIRTYTVYPGHMPNQPKTQHRSIRVPDDTWTTAMDVARANGTSVGEVVRDFLDWWLRTPGAKMPKRPDVNRTADGDHGQSMSPSAS